MKNGEYVLTEDTGAIVQDLYGGVDKESNALYLGRVATILSDSSLESTIRVFDEESIDVAVSERMTSALDADPYAVCLILDRYLGRNIENDPMYADRIKRFSITRSYDGQKISRIGQPSPSEQVETMADTYAGTDNKRVYLVDDGFFSGGTVSDVRKRVEQVGIDVVGAIGFLQSRDATIDGIDIDGVAIIPQLEEWIDLRDFSMFGGKINKKGQSGRAASTVPYIAPWANGEAASLNMRPDFFDISTKILDAQTDLLRSYEDRFGTLTVRDMVKAGYAVPTNIDKTIPITLNTNVVEYLQMCREIVAREQQRQVAIIDMDGTLYDLVSDKDAGYDSSQLKQRVEANALRFIKDNIGESDSEDVLAKGLNDPIGISAYLQQEYGVERSVYFDTVWDIDPEGIVKRDERLIEKLLDTAGGSIGSDTIKLILLTAAPRAWAKNVLEYLGLEDAFEAVYSGESYGRKQEVMEVLAGRYNPSNMVSIGDQMTSDILPAEALGMAGRLVQSTSDTLRVIEALQS